MRTKVFNLCVAIGLLLSLIYIPTMGTQAQANQSAKANANQVIFFASDGMRPDLMEKYAAQGAMPTYAEFDGCGRTRG